MRILPPSESYERLPVGLMHSYEVPEIIALPIERGSEGYPGWVEREVG